MSNRCRTNLLMSNFRYVEFSIRRIFDTSNFRWGCGVRYVDSRNLWYTSLSPPSPDFGSKMQLQGCMANSSFELRFCFNRRRRPKGHRQGRAKTRRVQHFRAVVAGVFLMPIGPSVSEKKHTRHNCSKMQTTLVLAKPLAVAFRPTPAVEAKM